jgi:hypothetical protein
MSSGLESEAERKRRPDTGIGQTSDAPENCQKCFTPYNTTFAFNYDADGTATPSHKSHVAPT